MCRIRRVILTALALPAILSGCSKSATAPDPNDGADNAPPPLSLQLRTDDAADLINVVSEQADLGALVRICLNVNTTSGWWKGVGINKTEPTIEGDASDGEQCADIAPTVVSLTFWKAKGFGVHSAVGSRPLDLTRYAGYKVYLNWVTD